jgi:hypothetical protein
MARRMILMLALMTVVIAGLGFVKVRQFQAMAEQFAAMQPPPEAVTTIVAARRSGRRRSAPSGRWRGAGRGRQRRPARHRRADRVRVGKSVREGEVLVQLDTRQEQAQLRAPRPSATWRG